MEPNIPLNGRCVQLATTVRSLIKVTDALFGYVFELSDNADSFLRYNKIPGRIRDKELVSRYAKQIGDRALELFRQKLNQAVPVTSLDSQAVQPEWFVCILTHSVNAPACVALLYPFNGDIPSALDRLHAIEFFFRQAISSRCAQLVTAVHSAIKDTDALFGYVFELTYTADSFLPHNGIPGKVRDKELISRYRRLVGDRALELYRQKLNQAVPVITLNSQAVQPEWFVVILTHGINAPACLAVVYPFDGDIPAAVERLRAIELVISQAPPEA